MSSLPPTTELIAAGAPVVLRDGSRIRVRQGRASDRGLLIRGFERLSPESRYRRFLAATPELTADMVDYLTEIDHHDHEAIAAFDERTGEGVGVARYVRRTDRPETAEVAVTVVDDWQRRGVATVLLEVLAGRARAEGITSFTAVLLSSNQEMIDLIESLGPAQIVRREMGTTEVEVPLHEDGLSPVLRKLLRIAAENAPPRQTEIRE
jgi:GNAT superfamily N-acetyltransferase